MTEGLQRARLLIAVRGYCGGTSIGFPRLRLPRLAQHTHFNSHMPNAMKRLMSRPPNLFHAVVSIHPPVGVSRE
jgi:hypothetical protein